MSSVESEQRVSFDTYLGDQPDASFTDWIRERARERWDAAVSHRFLIEMAKGTLDPAVFRSYLIQEYAFIDISVTVLGYALARAPSLEEKSHLVSSLRGLTTTQDEFFRQTFQRLDVPPDSWRDPELPSVVDDFENLMIRSASHGRYVEPITVMMTAEWMYLTWTRRALKMASQFPDQPLYEEWLRIHVSSSFEQGVNWLKAQINRLGPDLPPGHQRELGDLFRRVLEMEIQFHDVLYQVD